MAIGDSCQDIYNYGRCDRLCAEAPVPIFVLEHTEVGFGMSYNVQRNIEALGVECDIITHAPEIKKIRYIETKINHMLLRVDENDKSPTSYEHNSDILKNYDAIVISDYNKGFLDESAIEKISRVGPVTFLDTKKELGEWANNITFIKINELEFKKTKHTLSDLLYKKLIITMGSEGCMYLDEKIPPPQKISVLDPSGAGDTFLAGLSVGYLRYRDLHKAIELAQKCSGEVIQIRGIATVSGKNYEVLD